ADLEDWSIGSTFPRIESGGLSFTGSSFLRHKVADIGRLGLPERYVAIQPTSPNDRQAGLGWRYLAVHAARPGDDAARDFTRADWAWLLRSLRRLDLPGVVLNAGGDPVPDDPRLIDLSGQTSFPESVEVLKGACGFVGIASSLSVLAAQRFDPSVLVVK